MAKRMLIDANHREETRVVVLSGKRIEEFDYETAARAQLKGNIYLAKITRVEPSLQAAFVEYGGNRHGFLPFSEIHPDYYKIPIADREALAAEEAALRGNGASEDDEAVRPDEVNGEFVPEQADAGQADASAEEPDGPADGDTGAGDPAESDPGGNGAGVTGGAAAEVHEVEQIDVEDRVDTVGGDEIDDQRRRRANLLRRYKIQEVIKRRQVILVQVSKEERGTKGAALTTYLSLAGRYCVLMPNTPRGGGISRKIGSANDRRRLKSILGELSIPEGMAVIVRTAGAQRSKAEVRRDYEYLMRLWDEIRRTTLQSTAPCLIHEEANLIKRSIRDLYSRDMEEVLVEGEEGYKTAKAFMRSLMPSHAKKVKQYKDGTAPVFHQFQVESQLDAMHSQTVQLKSGGYIVLNQTEALVAIDVNSGRATRERHIEETALKTNLEAADEVARQLRLRDLAGLVVVDFIDMEENRHNREVERRLKDAMRSDRARIQLGRLSPFGLLEMSRQRLRPSLFESSMDACPRCGGSGHVRSVHSSALAVLRSLEEEGLRGRSGRIQVTVPTSVALYFLNELRGRLGDVEQRYGISVAVEADDMLLSDDFRLDRQTPPPSPEAGAERADEEAGRKRRRRSRRRKDGDGEVAAGEIRAMESAEPEAAEVSEEGEAVDVREAAANADEARKGRRRRGRRGGRRRSRRRPDGPEGAEAAAVSASGEEGGEKSPSEAARQGAGATEGSAPMTDADIGEAPQASEAADPAGEAMVAAGDATETPRPKRRRRPSKRAAKDTAGEESASDETETASDEAVAKAENPPRRARKSPAKRSRKAQAGSKSRKPGKSAGEDAAVDAGSSPTPSRPQKEEPIALPSQSSESPESPALPAAAAPQDLRPESEVPDQPKRRGWWNRLV